MKIELCQKCGGSGEVFEPKGSDWVYLIRDGKASHRDFVKTCPQCQGNKVTPAVKSWNGVELKLRVLWSTILGGQTNEYRIRVKPGLAGQGFDLWVDGKKLTRGGKYLVAKNINHAIANILTGNDYKDAFKAEILG
jgi:hypothetical protein